MGIKSRKESVNLIRKRLDGIEMPKKEGGAHHYGRQELRELMDFIYGGKPKNYDEKLVKSELHRKV